MARLTFALQEDEILQQMKMDKENKSNDIAIADHQEQKVEDRIDEMRAHEGELEQQKELLRCDMLDLNYIEQQIMTTLKALNWEEKKIVEKLLFSQKDKLGFKSG